MLAPDTITGVFGGFIAGFGAAFACMRWMIRGALQGFELKLTEKFDARYHMLPQPTQREVRG